MEHLLYTLDWLLYILFAINVAYLLVCSLASLCQYKPFVTAPARTSKRFAVFIAAYREDAVILPTVHACLAQDYPDDRYDIVVISDHMQPETNAVLSSLPIKLLQVDFEKSTFAVFIAAYREDAVILPTVHACLAQDYPDDRYDVVVISDHMQPETNAVLSSP